MSSTAQLNSNHADCEPGVGPSLPFIEWDDKPDSERRQVLGEKVSQLSEEANEAS